MILGIIADSGQGILITLTFRQAILTNTDFTTHINIKIHVNINNFKFKQPSNYRLDVQLQMYAQD